MFSRMFPTIDAGGLHMNTIADIFLNMKLKPFNINSGVYLDYYQIKWIKNGCLSIKKKAKP